MPIAAPTTITDVIDRHLQSGSLTRVNASTFVATSTVHGASATVRAIQGRAIVDFGDSVPAAVPTSPLLRSQMAKFGGAFYASGAQLDEFLREMSPDTV